MNGEITWAGVALSGVCNAIIEAPPETNRPERKVDRYDVPGRNGAIIIPQYAWENVERSYDLDVYGDYNDATEALMAWLYAPEGYQRLEDSFDADVYRRAYVSEGTRIRNLVNTDGRCTVEFNCDPRRFLKSGETEIVYNSQTELTIENPTKFAAWPLIQIVNGSGAASITIGGNTITINEITNGMTLDCETMQAYNGTENLNGVVSGDFPVIPPNATNTITLTGGIVVMTITPRWWSL